jgi:hypothetical protein
MNQHIVAQDRLLELIGGLLLGDAPTMPFL